MINFHRKSLRLFICLLALNLSLAPVAAQQAEPVYDVVIRNGRVLDGAGRPLRKYEVLIPAVADTFRGGVPLLTSLADPVAYAQVSVSTADNRPHSPDAPKWAAGHFGSRFGNEGNVGGMATVFRVRREPPPPPVPPPDSERVFATPADYHSESFYTYRWSPVAHLKTHIFRAVDDAV